MTRSIPEHLDWLVETGRIIKTGDGHSVRIIELRHKNDDRVLSAWAKHFRQQYCSDNQIDMLRNGTGLSRAAYLRDYKFPDKKHVPGPSIRSGDFGEILVADYVEFVLGYWLPRTRYDHKAVRNESTKGSDIIGFKIIDSSCDSVNDTLAIFEAKAKFTGRSSNGRLQAAVDHSGKDEFRKADSLNAIKHRYLDLGQLDEVLRVERFQNPEDRPYREKYGAVALISTILLDRQEIRSTITSSHPNPTNLSLIVIHGSDMMMLVHELYRRAADEA